MPNGVHAAVHTKQPPTLRPHPDCARAQAQLGQLTVRYHSVLSCGKRREPLIDGGFVGLIPHIGTKTASPPIHPLDVRRSSGGGL